MSFCFTSAADLVAAYRDRRSDPVRVIERALAAAAALDQRQPPMRTFIALDAGDARRQAEASRARWQQGRPLGPLDGVPVAIKDEIDVAGYGTSCGTRFLGHETKSVDATTVARLRRGGAIIFGKTNMHELGVAPSGLNAHHGSARNPYDPARDTGGSSSGSGAVVAAGVVPLAMGNDGGGSVRIPAALCGVAGIKASFGRVPLDGVAMLCWSLEHSGPLGATIADLVTALAAITDEQLTLPAIDGRQLRVGICDAWWQWADDDLRTSARAALERVGVSLVPIALPHIELTLPVGSATFLVEGAAAVAPYLDAKQPMSASTRIGFDVARGMTAVAYVQAQRARALIVRDFERAFAEVDLIATPTTAITAPRYHQDSVDRDELDEGTINRLIAFTMAFNLTGMPATSVPCGYDREQMPIGLQIVGPLGADLLTLALAAEVERRSERQKPQVWFPLLES
jgi:Asp-tRNA(Asn)/Glu-tRNA(Gln) amidotransferase A subunit family amidase